MVIEARPREWAGETTAIKGTVRGAVVRVPRDGAWIRQRRPTVVAGGAITWRGMPIIGISVPIRMSMVVMPCRGIVPGRMPSFCRGGSSDREGEADGCSNGQEGSSRAHRVWLLEHMGLSLQRRACPPWTALVASLIQRKMPKACQTSGWAQYPQTPSRLSEKRFTGVAQGARTITMRRQSDGAGAVHWTRTTCVYLRKL